MQQNTPQQALTLSLLNARITKAKAEFDTLIADRRMDLKTRAERLEAVAKNLSGLKTLKLHYMTELRSIRYFRDALTTGIWQGEVIGERERADLEAMIAQCEDNLRGIDGEVNS